MTANRLPNLQGVSSALDKLRSATEDSAKAFLAKVEAVDGKRQVIFGRAGEKLTAHESALAEVDKFLEDFDRTIGDNSGDPISDGSSPPSAADEPKKT